MRQDQFVEAGQESELFDTRRGQRRASDVQATEID